MRDDESAQAARPKILIVDDRAENLRALEKLLSHLDVEVVQALSGADALSCVLSSEYAVAIVDIQMPGMDGYELVEALRSNLMTASMPVIFVSAIYSDEYHHRKAYESGAVDFLSKPIIPEILISKVKVFLDLYQQRQAVEQANAALKKANADKDKLFSIISHDLRAPFNVVLGFTELMEIQAPFAKTADMVEMAQAVHSSAKAAYALIDNLLTWSRLQREKGLEVRPEAFVVSELTKEVFEACQHSASAKEIGLSSEVDLPLQAHADRWMIHTILRNLIGNAIKFTPRGGSVAVIALADGRRAGDGMLSLGVRDTGVGMTAEVQAKLFRIDTHHTTPGTEREAGSGLGLMICREMVERHGGNIWVESEEGQGSTIWFTIPCYEKDQQ